LGVDIRRGRLVEEVRLEADGVALSGTHDGKSFALKAQYAIGADGARSIVRRAAQIEFAGEPPKQSMMMADARVDLPKGPPGYTVANAAGGLVILPLGDGIHSRIIRADPERSHVPQNDPLTQEELVASLQRIAGTDFNLREITWLTRFTDETRLAANYRNGRAFLVGDAAHIHAPMGGQGLNVGIQDSTNLGWKLAAVLKGHAPAALLDSFESERRPVGERLYYNTLAQAVLATSFDAAGFALRRVVDEFLRNPDINRNLAAELSGFGLVYPRPLLPDHEDQSAAPAHTGIRVADEDLELTNGTQAALFSYLNNGTWLHLSSQPERSAALPNWLNPECVVSVRAKPQPDRGLLSRYTAVLIRPDGHIASAVPKH
jgi:2-polyprenyl-6-methoxyphenol hydroxylase-like FAD-dependent oxidoreductase